MAATDAARLVTRLLARLAALLGGVFALGQAAAITLPENRAEALAHVYDGDGVRATGPALLIRKSLADKVSLSASYYVDMVSNASIDVVTTASPFKETRRAYTVGADYVERDTLISVSGESSSEPDYQARSLSVDVAQEVFGGMSTVSLGFTRGSDDVGQKLVGYFDTATHWQYRLGLTQVLTPRWLATANLEVVADEGYLGSPYRVARVFGAAVPERNPRTRTSRALKLGGIGSLDEKSAVYGSWRYFWDTWAVRAHTLEAGYRRYVREGWLADGSLRVVNQDGALFYSDNATAETRYITRNRQLASYSSIGLGAKLSAPLGTWAGGYAVTAHGGFERVMYRWRDFTDLRSGGRYRFDATVLQLYLTATY